MVSARVFKRDILNLRYKDYNTYTRILEFLVNIHNMFIKLGYTFRIDLSDAGYINFSNIPRKSRIVAAVREDGNTCLPVIKEYRLDPKSEIEVDSFLDMFLKVKYIVTREIGYQLRQLEIGELLDSPIHDGFRKYVLPNKIVESCLIGGIGTAGTVRGILKLLNHELKGYTVYIDRIIIAWKREDTIIKMGNIRLFLPFIETFEDLEYLYRIPMMFRVLASVIEPMYSTYAAVLRRGAEIVARALP